MTREEMAQAVESSFFGQRPDGPVIVAELRKTCATCQHWRDPHDKARTNIGVSPWCSLNGGIYPLPIDGSGFCHRWEVKP